MGIKGLARLIGEEAPKAMRQAEMKLFFGHKVAIDALMCLYQFLIAVRQQDGQQLTNEDGQTTLHLMGMFYRTLRMVDHGIKPCYVFDGKPPVLKGGELAKRTARRDEAQAQLDLLKDTGTTEERSKYERRLVRVTKEQNDEAKHLLKLMGIPYVEAPCEAEAQCAALAKAGKVYAAALEDMDTLCYETPYLMRHLTFSEARKMPIEEISYALAMEGLGLTLNQFVDMCILLGCDYCDTIRGVGPVTALKLIREHGLLEKIVELIEQNPKSKYKVPEDWPFREARQLFLAPEVANPEEVELKWTAPDEEALVEYMCKQNGFSEDRIRSGIEKLKKGLKGGTQGRLDGFFTVVKSNKPPAKGKPVAKGKVTKKRK